MTSEQHVPHLVLDGFLDEGEYARLLEHVRRSATFTPAHVDRQDRAAGEVDTAVRRAVVAVPDEEIYQLFEARLRALLPHARRELGVGYFRVGEIERQFTAHGDGDFFDAHTDVGAPWKHSSGRRVSFVYYFHEYPRRFEGGELRLYDRHAPLTAGDDETSAPAPFRTIEPDGNTLVLFPSDALHEVRPVRVDGDPDAPGATRFTLTGWFHDADHRLATPPLDRPTRTALTERYAPSYTSTGFEVVRTPSAVHRALETLYRERFDKRFVETVDTEHLPTGQPDFIDIDDVKGQFHFALQSLHEDWSGCELVPTAVYGLRVYRAGQTLLPHTDTLETHVISSIVHIAHETEEPWPLWIKDLGGNEHDIVLEPGEMLLYESARCPHGRIVPLRGDSYCSLFVHYRPIDWHVDHQTLIDRAIAAGDRELVPEALWPGSSGSAATNG